MSAGLVGVASMFVAGLASSLHCVGMCGPLLIGLSTRGSSRGLVYHVGRIWTYVVLALVLSLAGQGLLTGSGFGFSQRTLGLVLAALVVLTGLVFAMPGRWLSWQHSVFKGCPYAQKIWMESSVRTLIRSDHWVARFLIGALMGLIPCGLVYAMLVVAIALPTPAHAGVGMALFGLGTVPALSLTQVGSRFLSRRWLGRAPLVTGLVLVVMGLLLAQRAMSAPTLSEPTAASCHTPVVE